MTSIIQAKKFDAYQYINFLTSSPGVYRMLGRKSQVIYVGKAKNLKKRVSSYFRKNLSSLRIRSMVCQITSIEVTVTRTETEALILENNLIKSLKPRYNILLRDDKSYPYIFISTADIFPRIVFHRGGRKEQGRYFGPYPSVGAVRETLNLLQHLFRIRQCENSFFSNRTRPCLQYQIKRCSGSCVGRIDAERYQRDIQRAIRFLEGRSDELILDLVEEMDHCAARLEYERAGLLRNLVQDLRQITERQYVNSEGLKGLDIVALAMNNALVCVQVSCIRGGRNLGNKSFFPRPPAETQTAELMQGFLGQYYLERKPPPEIIVSHPPAELHLVEQMLGERHDCRVHIKTNLRGERAKWLDMALRNTKEALFTRMALHINLRSQFQALQKVLGMTSIPDHLECFDISHTRGEAPVASCVVFGQKGALKSDYRRFNISNITPGNDYAAMHQVLLRRFRRIKEQQGIYPDVLVIDGGRGQVLEAEKVLNSLQIKETRIIGVTKGEGRRPELDKLTLNSSGTLIKLPANSSVLHLLQQIRDEAHRFAISGHRNRRAKARTTSPLEDIPGLGPKRRQNLLKYFGGLQGVTRASAEELSKTPGISSKFAWQVYDYLHLK